MSRTLILVRHGQSEWNLKNLFTGWKNPDLTAKGIEEARDAGKRLKAAGFAPDYCFTSALKRAQHTLDLMLEEMGIVNMTITRNQALNERDYGDLAGLVRKAAAALGDAFDIEILEMHHNRKVDAPSGTALMLGEAAAAGRNIGLAEHTIPARSGVTGPRPRGGIGFAALRGGSVVGDHTVILAGEAERIELTHRAESRTIFANGAVRAALWAAGQPAGLYSMADVLGFTEPEPQ
jgi:dihydrodipicolinate reductase